MPFNLSSRATLYGYNFSRPQAMIWSNKKFIENGTINGFEPPEDLNEATMDAIILPDHGRGELSLDINRIESRARMINGTSRSYWTSDKATLSTSWDNLPSRISEWGRAFDENGHQYPNGPSYSNNNIKIPRHEMFLADNAADAMQIIKWYKLHQQPFYVYLSYDDAEFPTDFEEEGITNMAEYVASKLKNRYVKEIKMYFSSFSSKLLKRGKYDLWNISVGLEEV